MQPGWLQGTVRDCQGTVRELSSDRCKNGAADQSEAWELICMAMDVIESLADDRPRCFTMGNSSHRSRSRFELLD